MLAVKYKQQKGSALMQILNSYLQVRYLLLWDIHSHNQGQYQRRTQDVILEGAHFSGAIKNVRPLETDLK